MKLSNLKRSFKRIQGLLKVFNFKRIFLGNGLLYDEYGPTVLGIVLGTLFGSMSAGYVVSPATALAADSGGVQAFLDTFKPYLKSGLELIGAGLILFGGIQIAIGVRSERPDESTNGFRTLAAGAIVFALGTFVDKVLVWSSPATGGK